MDADIEDENEVLEWIVKRKTTTTIHKVTDEILTDLVENHEYVAVYFQGADCDQNKEVKHSAHVKYRSVTCSCLFYACN